MNASTPSLPGQPRDEHGPVFAAPWEAQAFAIAVTLHERGLFTWSEWAETLAGAINDARATGDPDLGGTYYEHWIDALEQLVAGKGASTTTELASYRDAWEHAAERTPHGRPIALRADDFGHSSE